MEVTLKKAAMWSQMLIDAAKSTDLNPLRSLSIFAEEVPSEMVEREQGDLKLELEKAMALTDAGYLVRTLIAKANTATPISDLLAQVAAIDKKLTILSSLSSAAGSSYGAVQDTGKALDNRVAFIRAERAVPTATASRNSDTITVSLATSDSEFVSAIDKDIAAFKRARNSIKDRLTELNFTTKVTIPEDVTKLMQDNGLI